MSPRARIAAQLVLVPAESSKRMRDDVAGLMADAHPAFVDTLLAGMQEKRALLTDDLGLRLIAQECGVPCTWTQPFLQMQVRNGSLSPANYQVGLGALIASHYDFTQLGHAEILAELRASNWTISESLRRMAAAMARSNVDRQSVARVLAELAIESRFGNPTAPSLAAFHMAYVTALSDAGAADQAKPIYQMMLIRMKAQFYKLLVQRQFRKLLLQTTSSTPAAELTGELDERATALTRETWQVLIEGGLRVENLSGVTAVATT